MNKDCKNCLDWLKSIFGSLFFVFIICVCIFTTNQNIEKTQVDMMNTQMDVIKKLDQLFMAQQKIIAEEESEIIKTEMDLELVQRIVMAEARGSGTNAMMGVAQTIRDRAQLWDMSIEAVCTAKSQFAYPYEGEITQECKDAVNAVFLENKSAFDGYVTHFHSDYITPYWTKNKTFIAELGGLKFWY